MNNTNNNSSFVGPNGNTVNDTNKVDFFSLVLKTAKIAVVTTWIILPIIYYVFYFKSDVPDLFHILDSNPENYEKCYNVSIITSNIKNIYITIKSLLDSVQRF